MKTFKENKPFRSKHYHFCVLYLNIPFVSCPLKLTRPCPPPRCHPVRQTESGLGRAELRRLCELMVRHELLLRCGVSHLVYVSRAAGQPWVLHSYHMTRTQQDTVASRVAAAGGDLRAAPDK